MLAEDQFDLFAPAPRLDITQCITGSSMLNKGSFTSVITANGQQASRETKEGEYCDFYRNLNKPAFFSCKQRSGELRGKVSGYANIFVVNNPSFHVGAGRARVLVQKKRNVHAFLRGNLQNAYMGALNIDLLGAHQVVTYNPYKSECFHYLDTNESVGDVSSMTAILYGSNVYLVSS